MFYSFILQDALLRHELGVTGMSLTPEQEDAVYEVVVAAIRTDTSYVYPPPNLDAAVRIYLGYVRFDWFGMYYLQSIYADCQSTWRKNWGRARHFQAAPRDHGKSHIYSFELPIYKICYVDNVRILMASKTDDLAAKYLGAIKRTIETNERIRIDFGDLTEDVNPVDGEPLEGGKGKGGWSKHTLFCRRTNHSLKDGTLESIGWGGAITGSRFDLIILDDPIEESDCRTEKKRKGQQNTLHKLEELLEPDGQFLVIGTRKHYGDLYGYILDNPRWTFTIDKGIIRYPDNYEYVYEWDETMQKDIIVDVDIPESEEFEVLWPEKWSIKDLLIKKAGSLPQVFQREIQNEVTSDEISDFKKDWIERNKDIKQFGNRFEWLRERPTWAKWVVIGVDLSGVFSKKDAEESDSDYTVMPVYAIDDQNKRHLIYAFRGRGLDVEEQLDIMIELNHDFNPDFMVVETNAYQKVMQSLALKKRLPILPHNTGGEKHGIEEGLPRLALEIKNQYFVWYTGKGKAQVFYDILFNEFYGFGVEEHDDIVMATWFADLGVNWLIQKEQRRRQRKKRKMDRKQKRVEQEAEERVDRGSIVERRTEKEPQRKSITAARELLEEKMKKYEIKTEGEPA